MSFYPSHLHCNGTLVCHSPPPSQPDHLINTVRKTILPNTMQGLQTVCCRHQISRVLTINIYELTAALPVSRKEYCWPANKPLRSIRNPLVRIWWLNLSVAWWGELASHVSWDLASCECTHWGENISRGRVGSRGRGSLTNVTSWETKKLDLHLTPGCLHSCSINHIFTNLVKETVVY